METPIRILTCPSRRSCEIWPVVDLYAYVRTPKPFGNVTAVARGDYAINAGASNIFSFKGPADLVEGDDSKFWKNSPYPKNFSGISHSNCCFAEINHGRSQQDVLGWRKTWKQKTMKPVLPRAITKACTQAIALTCIALLAPSRTKSFPYHPFARPLMDISPADSIAVGATLLRRCACSRLPHEQLRCAVQFVSYDIDPEIHLRAGHRLHYGAPSTSLN